jgi:hypothetical protein
VHAAMAGGGFEVGGQASRRGARELKAFQETAMAYEPASSSCRSAWFTGAASMVMRRPSQSRDDTYAIHRRATAGISWARNDPAS